MTYALDWQVGPDKAKPVTELALPWTSYIPVTPTPKQLAFLLLPTLEALFGGAAGPGKSIALLMAALQYVETPGYAALILRKTYSDLSLPEALMDVAHKWLDGTDARWDAERHTWIFPSGASLSFGYLEHPQHKYRYQSAAFQFIGFDELTQFQETDYRYLFSRLRRSEGSSIPLRMRAASNPGNIGHEWVKQRFMVEQGEDRVFLPAKIADNPYLDKESYIRSLDQLDPITRQQLLDGDWTARQQGGKFRREWFTITLSRPVGARWVRRWDMAATEAKPGKDPDWTVGLLMGLTKNGSIYIADIRRMRGSPGACEALVKQTALTDGRDVAIRMEQEPGASGVKVIDDYRRRVLQGFDFKGVPSTGNKELRANPLSSQAEAGNVNLIQGPWIIAFLDELELFPQGAHDDQCFPAGTLIMTLRGEIPIESVLPSDHVLTRIGWRRVVSTSMTGLANTLTTIYTTSGTVSATPDHRFWVEGCGFIPISKVGEGTCLTKLSSSMGASTTAVQMRNRERIGCITNAMTSGRPRLDIYTAISGSSIMAQYQKGLSYTTKTGIPSTMTLAISNALASVNTLRYTGQRIGSKAPVLNISSVSEALRRSGIVQKPDENGTENTGAGQWQNGQSFNGRAAFVTPYSRPSSLSQSIVQAVVQRKLDQPVPVYDISVQSTHEYFANGFLVHNCDAASGAYADLTSGQDGVMVYDAMAEMKRMGLGIDI